MEKGRTMKKLQKAVLRNSIVMLSLFALAVASSGVAQAQECFAFQSGANTVRAEGMTEAVGNIQLQCRNQETFGQPPIGDKAVISITLNTMITNAMNEMVMRSRASPTLMYRWRWPLPWGRSRLCGGG